MYPPPRLTRKELEIVPHLAKGENRRDLAKRIGVSPETIKIHVRNILRKYDAVNLNDAINHLRQHSEYFFGPHAIFDTFCHSSYLDVTINTKAKTINCILNQEFEIMANQVFGLRLTAVDSPCELLEVKIDGQTPNSLGLYNGRRVFETPFDPPKPKGNRFTRISKLLWSMPENPYDVTHFAGWITYPSTQLEMNIRFISDIAPKHIYTETTVSHHTLHDDSLHATPTRCGVRMVTHNPNVHKSYIARWTWA